MKGTGMAKIKDFPWDKGIMNPQSWWKGQMNPSVKKVFGWNLAYTTARAPEKESSLTYQVDSRSSESTARSGKTGKVKLGW